jgi:hypothetical protein
MFLDTDVKKAYLVGSSYATYVWKMPALTGILNLKLKTT